MASINQIKRSAYVNKYLKISSESSEPIIVKKNIYIQHVMLVAVSKGMQTVKLCTNIILHSLLQVLTNAG